MRTKVTYPIKQKQVFLEKLLRWSQQYDDIVWLDTNQNLDEFGRYDAILAVDALTSIQLDSYKAFEELKNYQTSTKDWIFGYLSYDLKNDTENLKSNNFDALLFPELYFFQPKKLFLVKNNSVELHYLRMVDDEIAIDYESILNMTIESESLIKKNINIKPRIHKEAYFKKIKEILNHIERGDIYEANFCQEFYAENAIINPIETYNKLNFISKPPFAAFLKMGDRFLLSASPERYLNKTGNKIVSQPMKGTARRSDNLEEDFLLKQTLQNDEKERSENIMIVDLVRNDLSQTAIKGSVKVNNLCEVKTFLQVHQMISTVISEIDSSTSPVDVIKTTFPMGSMTGAPKISAMQIIEKVEETKRGLYSGAVGYFNPNGDFDFNVVIRSILYNQSKSYVSYSVGGAITAKSHPKKEYEECMIKAKAIREVLEN